MAAESGVVSSVARTWEMQYKLLVWAVIFFEKASTPYFFGRQTFPLGSELTMYLCTAAFDYHSLRKDVLLPSEGVHQCLMEENSIYKLNCKALHMIIRWCAREMSMFDPLCYYFILWLFVV